MESTLHSTTNLFLEKSEERRASPVVDKGISFAAVSTLRTTRLLPHVFAGIVNCNRQKDYRITVYFIQSDYEFQERCALSNFVLVEQLKRTVLLSLSL